MLLRRISREARASKQLERDKSSRTAAKSRHTSRGRATPAASGRYTPPIPRDKKVSPRWVPTLMFVSLGLGMAVIIVNYLGVLPGQANNGYLIAGLVLILIGFLTATRYH